MDKKKVTRRAVIGTAIGTLAVSPFIIRALRERYDVELPESEWEEVPLPPGMVVGENPDYGNEWKRDLRTVNIPVKAISGPSTYTLNYKPEVGSNNRLVLFNAAYSEQGMHPTTFPELPTFYVFVDGLITAVPPIVDDKPTLSISEAMIATKSRMVNGGESSGSCIVVMDNATFDYYQIEQGSPRKVSKAKVSPACSVVGSQLAFDYPKGKPLSRGAKWTLTNTALKNGLVISDKIDLNCEVVGFAEVAGRQTVKMQAEKRLTSQAYADVVAATGGTGPEEAALRSSVAEDSEQKIAKVQRLVNGKGESSRAEQILREGISKKIHLVSYVDLKTGVPARRELTQALHNSKHPDRDMMTYTFSQVLEG